MTKGRVVLLVLLAVGVGASVWRLAGRPAGHVIQRVVLISIDTCRADHLSCYGFASQTTPHIDAVARQGVRFENVIAPMPLTLPSHSTMHTGANPPTHGVHDNFDFRLGPSNQTLAEVLKTHGLATAAFVSTFVLDSQFGLDQGFDTYDDDMGAATGSAHLNERKADKTTDAALAWLGDHYDKPFFLFIHYYDPHLEYEAPEPFASRWPDNGYAAEIAYADHAVGRVIARLKSLGLYDSTLLVITSDHGEMRGEHGEQYHSYFIYQSVVRVPLIFKLPGTANGQGGRTVTDIAGVIDIVPTICALVGVAPSADVYGKDLSASLRGSSSTTEPRNLYCESFTPLRYGANSLLALVGQRWKLIQTTRPELYDVTADPAEWKNLAGEHPDRLHAMQEQLRNLLQEQQREVTDSEQQMDAETIRRIESIGYTAGGTLSADAGYDQDTSRGDPKDLIELHAIHGQVNGLIEAKRYVEARRLCTKMLQQRPSFMHAHLNMGRVLMNLGDFQAAVTHLNEVLKIESDNADAYNRMGVCHTKLGKLDKAIAHYELALAIDPQFAEAHSNLGVALMTRGDSDAAISHHRQALQIRPKYADAHVNLGIALESRGQAVEALKHFEQAVNLNPESFEGQRRLAGALAASGQMDQAVVHFQSAARLAPDHAEVRLYLAKALTYAGRPAQAVAPLAKAVELRPDWPAALNALAWVLATHHDAQVRDPSQALQLAKRASELTEHEDPTILDTLAVAYAATANYDQAIKTARQAMELLDGAEQNQLADEIRQRVSLYKAGSPYVHRPKQ